MEKIIILYFMFIKQNVKFIHNLNTYLIGGEIWKTERVLVNRVMVSY